MRKIVIILILIILTQTTFAQSVLNRIISVDINNLPLEKALRLISNKGNFYFSYNSIIIPKSKIVSYSGNNKTVKQVLDVVLEEKYEYVESNNYIILKLLPARIAIVTSEVVLEEKFYHVKGYVLDENTK